MKLRALSLACAALTLGSITATTVADATPRYDRHGRYAQPQRIGENDRVWVGRDGRYHCRRSNGTTGLVIGAAGGALIGRTIDTRGDRAAGTIIGAVGGALLGREIDRSSARCR